MPWINNVKDVCGDVVCGSCLGLVKGVFGVSLFTTAETEEINSLKSLALSVMQKSPEVIKDNADAAVCQRVKTGNQATRKTALEQFTKNASPEDVTAGVVATAELVCKKSFYARFAGVLKGACLNLLGC